MLNIELWEQKKKELKLTFDQLSEVSGIPKRTILGIFRKEVKTPRIDTVQAIEKALGLSAASEPQWTAEDKAEGVVTTIRRNLTAEEDELLSDYREIMHSKGYTACNLARKLVKQIKDS